MDSEDLLDLMVMMHRHRLHRNLVASFSQDIHKVSAFQIVPSTQTYFGKVTHMRHLLQVDDQLVKIWEWLVHAYNDSQRCPSCSAILTMFVVMQRIMTTVFGWQLTNQCLCRWRPFHREKLKNISQDVQFVKVQRDSSLCTVKAWISPIVHKTGKKRGLATVTTCIRLTHSATHIKILSHPDHVLKSSERNQRSNAMLVDHVTSSVEWRPSGWPLLKTANSSANQDHRLSKQIKQVKWVDARYVVRSQIH